MCISVYVADEKNVLYIIYIYNKCKIYVYIKIYIYIYIYLDVYIVYI